MFRKIGKLFTPRKTQNFYNKTSKKNKLTADLVTNLNTLKENILFDCNDVKYKDLYINFSDGQLKGTLIFVDGLVESEIINRDIINPLLTKFIHFPLSRLKTVSQLQYYIPVDEVESLDTFSDIPRRLFSGDSILLVDTFNSTLVLNTKGFSDRGIEESKNEHIIRGPKDSFIENIRTNTSLIRRKLKDPNLKIKELSIGERSKTTVAVLYIDDLVHKDFLNSTIERLNNIKINGIFETAYLEQYLENNPYSIFPQMQTTERPDKVCSYLLEGKIAIFVDGSPNCLLLPVTLSQLFQSPDDYYERVLYGNFLRIVRYIGFFVTTTLPAFYVSLTTFHQDVLPLNLAITIAKSRAEVPYPPLIEVLLMEIAIEFLREASARLPSSIGQTIGIVGAIILGDAAVKAGLVSSVMVIVVATTAIGAYIVPYYSATYALRFIRIPLILAASAFGAFGMVMAWCWILAHLCRLSSFGHPYLFPLSPSDPSLVTDAVTRKPLYNQQTSPKTKRKRRAK
ncbi:spore germination protein [Anaerobranca gottschalkii]|uniref:Spore germination protein KA n=1 Tax=Anaerobranca gottschalkii DSM 13577 TaxID=1120990 RepID=A0A1H9YGN8_9FIRM|nr:spore germination protein [Anaerobranca gottschalkii]SES68104.1 spore germination protein KA [Anaerobranca gottschalkii DSM 13577]